MPVIPYPNVDRALHQVNRHQVERGPRIQIMDGDTLTEISVGYPSRTTMAAMAEALGGLDVPAFNFRGFPGQRRPADG